MKRSKQDGAAPPRSDAAPRRGGAAAVARVPRTLVGAFGGSEQRKTGRRPTTHRGAPAMGGFSSPASERHGGASYPYGGGGKV